MIKDTLHIDTNFMLQGRKVEKDIKTGVVRRISHYRNGKLHGELIHRCEAGKTEFHSLYINGQFYCSMKYLSEEDKLLLSIKHSVQFLVAD